MGRYGIGPGKSGIPEARQLEVLYRNQMIRCDVVDVIKNERPVQPGEIGRDSGSRYQDGGECMRPESSRKHLASK